MLRNTTLKAILISATLLLSACGQAVVAPSQTALAPTQAPTTAPTLAPTVAPSATSTPTNTPTAIPKTVVRLSAPQISDADSKMLQTLIGDFAKANNDIEVKLEQSSGDYNAKLSSDLVSGVAADVFVIDFAAAASAMSKGQLLALDDALTKVGVKKDAFAKPLVDGFSAQGKLYALPKEFSTLALFYNKDLLKQAGVAAPTNTWKWADLRAAAARLTNKRNGVYGFATPPDAEQLVALMAQNDADVLSADQRSAILDSNAALAAADFYAGVHRDGIAAMPQTDLGVVWQGEAFAKGKVAMIYEGAWLLPYLKTAAPNLNYGVVELPLSARGSAGNVALGTGWTINAKTKNADAATKLIAYLTGSEAQTKIMSSGLAAPSRVEFGKSAPDTLKPFYAGAASARAMQFGANTPQVIEQINVALDSMLNKNVAPRTALLSANQKINTALK